MKELSGQRVASYLVAIAAFVLVGASGVGFVRDYARGLFLKSDPPHIAPASKSDASKWLDSVRKGETLKAVVIASKIVPDSSFEMPRPEYLGLISDCHVRLGLLTDSFNFADFARWRDLDAMNALAQELTKGNDKPVKAIFDAVMGKLARVSKEELGKSPPLSAMDPWRDGRGNSSDRLRLLCGLSGQAGYDCVVVGLFKTFGQVLHELCEIRKGSEVWLADTASGTLWEGMDASALAARPDLIPKDWSEERKSALKGPYVILIPAEPQDFRRCDLLLYSRLAPLGVEGLPRLPQDPQSRLQSQLSMRGSKDFFSYWRIPWLALRSIKGDPGGWLIDKAQ